MGAHALGAAAYAAKSAALAAPDRLTAASDEIVWQMAHMDTQVRAALQQLPPLGEDSAGPLGSGLLASGILGSTIRTIQANLRRLSAQECVRENGGMVVEVLHIDDCPNWEEGGARLRVALAATGHPDVAISFRLLRVPADADGTAFAGSPTFTIDGIDLFPSAGTTSDLACRIYQTTSGLAGLPTTEQFIGRIAERV
jgi:hypothetical protein